MSWRFFLLCVGALWFLPSLVHARESRIPAGIGAADHTTISDGRNSPGTTVQQSLGVSAPVAGAVTRSPAVLPGGAAARALEIVGNSRAVLGSMTSVFDRCKNLFATVCGGQYPKDEEALVGPRVKDFMKSFAKSQGINFGKLAGLLSNVVRHSQTPAYKDLYGKYLAHFTATTPNLSGIFDQAKASLMRAIAKMPVTDAAKAGMEKKLAEVGFTTKPNLDKPEEVEEFGQNCGPDAMEATAFARPTEKDVMICPGLVIRALALGGTAELEHYLLHAIGHECTHHFGADIHKNSRGQTIGQSPFRSEFTGTLGCYAKNFNGIDPVLMGGEIAADIGSAKAIAEKLRGSTPDEAIKVLRETMGPICGTRADGVHPSDKFRINVLLGQDPDIGEVLGCQVPPSSCALPKSEGSL